jgi:hypothetical protein
MGRAIVGTWSEVNAVPQGYFKDFADAQKGSVEEFGLTSVKSYCEKWHTKYLLTKSSNMC